MITNLLAFMSELGFTDIQIYIYNYLISHKFGTINDIKHALNYSYSQVHHNLSILEEKKLIESSSDLNPKLYFRKNPKITLNELINKKFSEYTEKIDKLEEEIKVQESNMEVCTKYRSFYHYSDINLGIENFYDMIENAEKEIIMTVLPPSIFKRLEPVLYSAFKRGLIMEIYYSDLDLIQIENYFEKITNILKRIGISIIETKNRTCQSVWYNDKEITMGNLFIDEYFLNSIIFHNDKIYHIDGFPSPDFVKQTKGSLMHNPVIKRIEMEYPSVFQDVLSVIEKRHTIKTRDLSSESKIGGGKLKEILEFLTQKGVIKEEIIKPEGAGRPKRVYSIIE